MADKEYTQEDLLAVYRENCVLFHLNKLRKREIILIGLLYWLIGFVFSILSDNSQQYVVNVLSWLGPIWLVLGLLAFRWFVINYIVTLFGIHDAFDMSFQAFKEGLRFCRLKYLNLGLILLLIPIILLLLWDAWVFWHNDTLPEFLQSWTQSRSAMLTGYYLSYQTFILSLIVSTALVIVFGSFQDIASLSRYKIKLDYYHRLEKLTTFSVSLGLWSVIAFSQTLIITRFIRSGEFVPVLLTVIAIIILLAALFVPIILIHNIISQSKEAFLQKYEPLLHTNQQAIHQAVQKLVDDGTVTKASHRVFATIEFRRKLQGELEKTDTYLNTIPNWPVHWVNVARITTAISSVPIISSFASTIGKLL